MVAVLLRTLRGYAFTIAGIAIGVAGIVALGAMAERIVRFIEGGDRFVLGQISVAGRGMGMGTGFTAGGLLPVVRDPRDRRRARRRRRAGAGDAAAEPFHLAVHDPDPGAGPRPRPRGADAQPPLSASSPSATGRFLRPGDRRVAVVGASFAASHGLRVGGTLTLEGEPYQIVGVLERTLTAPDRFVIVPIEDARAQWIAKDPLLRTVLASGGVALQAADLNTGAAVGWRDGEDPDAVARRIAERVSGVNVQIPSELSRPAPLVHGVLLGAAGRHRRAGAS